MQAGAMMRKRIAIGQMGGPTAVLNGSLLGFLKVMAAQTERPELYGISEGMSGLVAGAIFPIDLERRYDWLRIQPGAVLGAGRMTLTGDDIDTAVEQLRRRDIHYLALAGGNGTMWACRRLAEAAEESGYELHVVGIPKTVDNDIMVTDHTPGFPSGARFVANAVRDLGADLASMRNFEQVRVVETMGRNVGWLTAAANYFRERDEDAPHLIYIPEVAFDLEQTVAAVREVQRELGYCLVVVSEGLKNKDGKPLAARGINNSRRNGQGNKALGGVGALVAETISNELGLACRYENLGILQRCCSFAASPLDREEAEKAGEKAGELLLAGLGGVMVTIERAPGTGSYRSMTGSTPLEQVAGLERGLDDEFRSRDGGMTNAYREWLRPMIGEAPRYGRIWRRQTERATNGT